jgi:hypothetical protein
MTTLASTLAAVTVYREGAVCLRRARLEAPQTQVTIGDLPLSLEAGSLRARVISGDARIQAVRPRFEVQVLDELDVPAEAKALEAAREDLTRLEQQLARVEAELTELENLTPRFLDPKRGEPPRVAPVTAVLALAELVDVELEARMAHRRRLKDELADARRELELRQRRLHEISGSQRAERTQLRRVAVVTLAEAPTDAVELGLEYVVPGARWVPGYQLQLASGLTTGTLTMRASVAQSTGEDWTQVALSLSTALLDRRTDVPVLKALKIGRRQPPPAKSGWREPPPGLDELFTAFDAAHQDAPGVPAAKPPAPPRAPPAPAPAKKAKLEERARTMATALAATPPGLPQYAMRTASAGPSKGGRLAGAVAELAAGLARREAPAPKEALDEGAFDELALEASSPSEEDTPTGAPGQAELGREPATGLDAALQDYDRLAMAGALGPARGRLQPMGEWDSVFVVGISVQLDVVMAVMTSARQSALGVRGLELPANTTPVSSVESFDYRYDAATRVDVPSTGRWVSLPVSSCAVGLTPQYVCVPAVESKVYRTLQIANKGRDALLPGPVDVMVGEAFLMTTWLPAVPPRADAAYRLGLGVEEAIKVARKTSFQESTGGFLGGSTVLPHEIEVELNNRLATPARVEVRERIPWVDPEEEKDVKVEEPQVQPPWEKLDAPIDGQAVVRGARRWLVTVPPGEVLKLTAQYAVRLPSDRMLVGGNRRT